MDSEDDPVTAITSLLVLGVGLTALFLGYSWFWIAWVVGFAVVVPIVAILTGEDHEDPLGDQFEHAFDRGETEPQSKQDALDALRERYARGDLTEEQFERKLDRLLETETPEDVAAYRERETDRE